MLINFLFHEVDALNNDVQVVIHLVADVRIQLTTVKCVNGETKRAASTGISTATEVICAEAFTPCVTHTSGPTKLLVENSHIVRCL